MLDLKKFDLVEEGETPHEVGKIEYSIYIDNVNEKTRIVKAYWIVDDMEVLSVETEKRRKKSFIDKIFKNLTNYEEKDKQVERTIQKAKDKYKENQKIKDKVDT
jgi:uncharacterized membrane-anchored protein YjiN (DUF445 family)